MKIIHTDIKNTEFSFLILYQGIFFILENALYQNFIKTHSQMSINVTIH